jgi:hypothetical protein
MTQLARTLLVRLLDAIDAVFDAAAALWRVLLRGAFSPNARDYRSARFARLSPEQVLVQTVAINAESPEQARRAIRLDADRRLPLPETAALFDVAGPLASANPLQRRPEQQFLLGVARRDTLGEWREANGARGRHIEGFVIEPSEAPGTALVFRDETGERRRRLRRGVTALAIVALVCASLDTFDARRTHLETTVARAEAERLALQREIRRDARRFAETRAAVQALAASEPIGRMSERLSALARRLPPDTELRRVEWSARSLVITGVSASMRDAELELRRMFAGADIALETHERGPPDAFEARIAWRQR